MYTVTKLTLNGHDTITLDPSPAEVEETLRRLFEGAQEEGYALFEVDQGRAKRRLARPDPKVKEMLAVPLLAGG